MFSKETKDAIIAVANGVAEDMEYEFARDPEIVAETALDAGRLDTWGYPKADEEIKLLIKEHGYPKVLKAAAAFVPSA